jgi:HK97 gp10 family phage protein
MATNNVRVEVVGLKQANAALRKLPDFARGEAQQVMDTTAFQVAAQATARAPGRSATPQHGIHLKDAIAWKRRRNGAVVGVDARAFHWKFWEYGTSKMPATPMFRPAADAQRASHQTRMAEALTRANTKMAQQARVTPPPG